MKAKLKYNLDDSDDAMSHARALKSLDMAIVLFQIEANLRSECEGICESKNINPEAIDIVFGKIYNLFDEQDINMSELIR